MDNQKIDKLVWEAVFGKNKKQTHFEIKEIGKEKGIILSSINDFYKARAKEEIPLDFTVPAINVRGMAYDMARSIFKSAIKNNVGALIFEIARSEMGYTNQPPEEYSTVIIAAAIKEGFKGPLFLQGDHFQVKTDKNGKPKEGEIETIKELIKKSIDSGFYNIDIDISTLVDYSKEKIKDQQKPNYALSAKLADFIRGIEPKGVIVSLGGEIGHIGGKNSTKEELIAYMEGFNESFNSKVGLSKIAIQTGTHHGGVPLPDGSLAEVEVDFNTLKALSKLARKYDMGGAVQHGASTLPDKYFSQFPQAEAIEVHLATGFQNIVMDHPKFPAKLLKKMYNYLDEERINERKESQTDAQFHYKLRKKTWGKFKKECWEIPEEIKKPIRQDLKKRFDFMFKELNVVNSKKIIKKYYQ